MAKVSITPSDTLYAHAYGFLESVLIAPRRPDSNPQGRLRLNDLSGKYIGHNTGVTSKLSARPALAVALPCTSDIRCKVEA